MIIFTAKIIEVAPQMAMVLTLAAKQTGADPEYLALTAARESNFKTGAAARTSSARGLFQFIKQTWLRSVKIYGPEVGLARSALHIDRDRRGRYVVRNKRWRKRILSLRYSAKWSALIAGAMTRENARQLKRTVRKPLLRGDIYLTHFLGLNGAKRFLYHLRHNPNQPASRYFRSAARANRSIFSPNGRPARMRTVYRTLVAGHHNKRVIVRGTKLSLQRYAARYRTRVARRSTYRNPHRFHRPDPFRGLQNFQETMQSNDTTKPIGRVRYGLRKRIRRHRSTGRQIQPSWSESLFDIR